MDCCMAIENKIEEFEEDICSVLSQLCFHTHPKIIGQIQEVNRVERHYFEDLFGDRIDVSEYLFDGSACVFPGVKRYVSGRGKKRSYNPEYQAIIDDNAFPRHIWCFLESGKTYNGPNWKKTGLAEFELAHIFSHKKSELEFESKFFHRVQADLVPHGDFSCACNVILLPKGTVRPTDNSKSIKAVFYKRYIDLYGEFPLGGRSGFREDMVPPWYNNLIWNEPYLTNEWEAHTNKLMEYRRKRVTQIMQKNP